MGYRSLMGSRGVRSAAKERAPRQSGADSRETINTRALRAMADGRWHDGTAMAERLDTSPAALTRNLNRLVLCNIVELRFNRGQKEWRERRPYRTETAAASGPCGACDHGYLEGQTVAIYERSDNPVMHVACARKLAGLS